MIVFVQHKGLEVYFRKNRGALHIVFPTPLIQSFLQVFHGFKDFPVKKFSSETGVKAFHIAVLPR